MDTDIHLLKLLPYATETPDQLRTLLTEIVMGKAFSPSPEIRDSLSVIEVCLFARLQRLEGELPDRRIDELARMAQRLRQMAYAMQLHAARGFT